MDMPSFVNLFIAQDPTSAESKFLSLAESIMGTVDSAYLTAISLSNYLDATLLNKVSNYVNVVRFGAV